MLSEVDCCNASTSRLTTEGPQFLPKYRLRSIRSDFARGCVPRRLTTAFGDRTAGAAG